MLLLLRSAHVHRARARQVQISRHFRSFRCLREPQTFDDAQQVAVNLQKKKPVVLNFEKTEKSVANRIIDFISGTTYALNGDIKKISNNVILCAPSNVNVSYSEEEHRLGDDMSWLK